LVVVKELLGEMKDPSPLSLARRVAMIPPPPSHSRKMTVRGLVDGNIPQA
jgi:hypothetical protein